MNQLSFLSPRLTISSIFIDQSLSYRFPYSSSVIYHSIDYSSLLSFNIDCILDLSSVFIIIPLSLSLSLLFIRSPAMFSFDGWHCYRSSFIFIFSSRSTLFVLPFQYFHPLYPCFFFKGPIHSIEVYTDHPPYHIHSIHFVVIIELLFMLLFAEDYFVPSNYCIDFSSVRWFSSRFRITSDSLSFGTIEWLLFYSFYVSYSTYY